MSKDTDVVSAATRLPLTKPSMEEKHIEQMARVEQMMSEGKRLPLWALETLSQDAEKKLRRNGCFVRVWKHVKSGAYYRLDKNQPIVLHENDIVPMVVYGPDDSRNQFRWARRLDAFLERFVPVQMVERYEEIDA